MAAALSIGCMMGVGGVRAQAVDDLASRFPVAPEAAPDQDQLVRVSVNGVDCGLLSIRVTSGGIALPQATTSALHIRGGAGALLALGPESGITYRFDATQGKLDLAVPVSRLTIQRFAPEVETTETRLSPETWGAYADYDLNLRHAFSSSPTIGATSPTAFGGLADVRLLAPDMVGAFGFAYDSVGGASDGLVRLDSTLTWRPVRLGFSVSLGDSVSDITSSLAQARPYRFGGVQFGTDFSGVPGWSSSPIASVAGTAQAQSSIDVYLDGQRTYRTSTAGGPFSLVLPPGTTGVGANVVVTDVTGRSVVLAVDAPRVDAQILRQGLFLWSAGIGAPRFAYGTSSSAYDGDLYGYANARFGVWNRATATFHFEGGADLAEGEAGADVAVSSWLALHDSISASWSSRGSGGAGHFSFILAGPWRVSLEATASKTFGAYDDVVSASGRTYDFAHGVGSALSLPPTSQISARPSWQPTRNVSVSASYEADSYKGSPSVGFASLNANYLLADRIPLFATLSHAMGGERSTALVVGLVVSLGGAQASVSAGYGSTTIGADGARSPGGYSGGFTAGRPLGERVGDIGWDAYANGSPTGTFADADAQVRSGYGVAGLGVQALNGGATAYATLRGSAGMIAGHPFVTDPAKGGIIIADVGLAGIPVELNGYDKGRTARDGKLALSGAVPGAPQRVAIDTARIPIDAVASETDQLVTVRDGGAAVVKFGVKSSTTSASIAVIFRGEPPPVGSTLFSRSSSAPLSKEGRAYLPSLERNEVIRVDMPDGTRCWVASGFDGRGGVGRRIGPLRCNETGAAPSSIMASRDGGGVAKPGIKPATASVLASVAVVFHGRPPPVGSTLVSRSSIAPISKEGLAYQPSLERDEVVKVVMPDGTHCWIASGFDGHGGLERTLGPLKCNEARL